MSPKPDLFSIKRQQWSHLAFLLFCLRPKPQTPLWEGFTFQLAVLPTVPTVNRWFLPPKRRLFIPPSALIYYCLRVGLCAYLIFVFFLHLQNFWSSNLIPNFFVEHLQKTKDLSKNLNLENVTPERIFYTNTVCGVCNKYKVCWWGGHTWRRVCGQFNAPPVVHPGMHLALS